MYLTLFFSLLQKCHLTNSVALSDQTQPFIPSALPHQRNASFPLKALVEPSGTFTTCRGSPWPAQLGQHLGLAFRPPLPRAQGSGKPPFYISARARGRPFLGEPAWPITSHPGKCHPGLQDPSQPSLPGQGFHIPRAGRQLLLLWATSSALCLSWSPHLACLRLPYSDSNPSHALTLGNNCSLTSPKTFVNRHPTFSQMPQPVRSQVLPVLLLKSLSCFTFLVLSSLLTPTSYLLPGTHQVLISPAPTEPSHWSTPAALKFRVCRPWTEPTRSHSSDASVSYATFRSPPAPLSDSPTGQRTLVHLPLLLISVWVIPCSPPLCNPARPLRCSSCNPLSPHKTLMYFNTLDLAFGFCKLPIDSTAPWSA